MKHLTLPILFCCVLLTTACASTNPRALNEISAAPEDLHPAKLIVYREKSVQAGLADVYIGTDDGYFVQLGANQYAEVELRSGFYEFKAKAQGSVPSTTTIRLNPDETVCIKARPNHEELHLLAIPFVNALVPSFVMEETACVDLGGFERKVAARSDG